MNRAARFLLWIGLAVLAGCSPSQLSPTQATGTAMVAQKETAAVQLTTTPPTPNPTLNTTLPAPAWTPMPGEITAADNGSTFTIGITSRISVILSNLDYPQAGLTLVCTPQEAIGEISNIPVVPPPYYAVRFEGVEVGECNVQNGNFMVIIKVTASP